jgi:hypothetical protein
VLKRFSDQDERWDGNSARVQVVTARKIICPRSAAQDESWKSNLPVVPFGPLATDAHLCSRNWGVVGVLQHLVRETGYRQIDDENREESAEIEVVDTRNYRCPAAYHSGAATKRYPKHLYLWKRYWNTPSVRF